MMDVKREADGRWGDKAQSEWANVKMPNCSARSEQPTLLVRVAALHKTLDQIDGVLEGDGGKLEKDPGSPPVTAAAEMSVSRIGEGLDKAVARLQELRERLDQHMKALR